MVAPPCLLTLHCHNGGSRYRREATVSRSRFWEPSASDNALFTEVPRIRILGSSPARSWIKPRNAPALPLLIFFAGEAVQRRQGMFPTDNKGVGCRGVDDLALDALPT